MSIAPGIHRLVACSGIAIAASTSMVPAQPSTVSTTGPSQSDSTLYSHTNERHRVGARASVHPSGGALALDEATIPDINRAMDAGTLTAEQLVQRFLARVAAYDNKGPRIHAVMTLNPRALDEALALDAERRSKGRRSALHGIPFVLKDNFNTAGIQTTGGSVLLEGYVPTADAELVKRLRAAGAIVLAKVNTSEFASGGAYSSLGGQTLNPHALLYSPAGSSGGTGAAIAAAFAQFGLGTDTGGSIRGPATVNGVVALKPTHGLLSRSGIIPLALTFDTGGPFARNVTDLATTLGIMAGVDAADSATAKSSGHTIADYATALKANALSGARIGVARDFMGADATVDWVMESSLAAMRKAGATIVDVKIPRYVLDSKGEWYNAVRYPEFGPQMADYLRATPAQYPKSLQEMYDRTRELTSLGDGTRIPNASRWGRFKDELNAPPMTDYRYLAVRDHVMPMLRDIMNGIFASQQLDAIVYPTKGTKPDLIAGGGAGAAAGGGSSATNLANLTGFPDLVVPAGSSDDRLPIGISFFGRAWDEARLIGLGYSFEQATRARRLPVNTPMLAGDSIRVR
ncbi:MAG: amidase family protein [Gemmatimonas sp.]